MNIKFKPILFLVMLLLLMLPGGSYAQQQTATLSGTVTSGLVEENEEPEPLAGVTVTLATAANEIDVIMAPYAKDAVRRFEYITDKDGTFLFTDIPPGDYVIFAEGNDLANLAAITLVLEGGEAQEVNFSMTPGGSIIGEVTSSNDISIWGGAVTLFDRKLAVQTIYVRRNGTFLFEHVRPGKEYQLFVQTPTEAILSGERLEVVEGEPLKLDLEVDSASRLTGRIVSDLGEPVEAALVSLESDILRWSGLTDENGFYNLSGAGIEYRTIIPGEYNIRIKADRHVSLFEDSVDMSKPGVYTLNFTIDRAGTITGVVVDEAGVPLEDAIVSAIGETGSEYTTLTQYDGTYTLDLMDPEQDYTLTAFALGYMPDRIKGVSAGKGQLIAGVDFILEEGTYVEGTLTQAGNEPGTSAVVDFYDADSNVFSVIANDAGDFSFDGLEPGDYIVIASTAIQDFGYVGIVTVEDSSVTYISFELEETGILTGTANQAGVVVVTFEGVIVSVQPTQPDGSFEAFGLAPGNYEVRLHSDQGASETIAVSIEAGGQIEQDLTVE